MPQTTVFLTKAWLYFRGLEEREEFMQMTQPGVLSPLCPPQPSRPSIPKESPPSFTDASFTLPDA